MVGLEGGVVPMADEQIAEEIIKELKKRYRGTTNWEKRHRGATNRDWSAVPLKDRTNRQLTADLMEVAERMAGDLRVIESTPGWGSL